MENGRIGPVCVRELALRKQDICKVKQDLVFTLFTLEYKPDPVPPKERERKKKTAKNVVFSCSLTNWVVVDLGLISPAKATGEKKTVYGLDHVATK